jgi:NAD(P)-dependent dehydrogenase (short-subunit alcohol dehydrogenase family)
VWTPLIPASTPGDQTAEFGKQGPLGRPAQPAELAPAFVFLADERQSGFVNGEVLGVHGGVHVPF